MQILRSRVSESVSPERIHILRALKDDSLLPGIGQDKEPILPHRLDDDLPDLLWGHKHAMENSRKHRLGLFAFRVMPTTRSVSCRLVSTPPGPETPIPSDIHR
jgi:hypothetical protein